MAANDRRPDQLAAEQMGEINVTGYAFIDDLAGEVQPPAKGILSRTVFDNDHVKAVLFGFGEGEELSEHTASMAAVIHVIQGAATLTLDENLHQARAGTWVHMPPGLRHSVRAQTPVLMLLLLLKQVKS